MEVIKFIFGDSPRTTIAGYAGAIAVALLPLLQGGDFTVEKLLLAAAIAVLGRLAADGGVKK